MEGRRTVAVEDGDEVLCVATSRFRDKAFACATERGQLFVFDLRENNTKASLNCVLSSNEAATSACFHPKDENLAFVSVGMTVREVDLRKLAAEGKAKGGADEVGRVVCRTEEEVGQCAVSTSGGHLACADDSGTVTVIDLDRQRKGGKAGGSQAVKRLVRDGHQNTICSSVCFRPRQPWDVVSGGLDCAVVLWDFNKARAKLRLTSQSDDPRTSETQVFNPPMVHALAVPNTKSLANHVACARGDASVAVYEICKDAVRRRLLLKSSKGHSSSVGHCCFAEYSADRHLISGGNDGRLVVWNWLQDAEGAEDLVSWSGSHGSKVNWTATLPGSSENVLVADTSNKVSVYTAS